MEPIRLPSASDEPSANGSRAASDLSGQEVGTAVAGILAAAEHAAAEITRRSAEIQDEIRVRLESLLGALADVQNMLHGIAQDVEASLDDIAGSSAAPEADPGEEAQLVAVHDTPEDGYRDEADLRYDDDETHGSEDGSEDGAVDGDAEPKKITPQDLIWEIS